MRKVCKFSSYNEVIYSEGDKMLSSLEKCNTKLNEKKGE